MARFLMEHLALLVVATGALTSQLLMKQGLRSGGPPMLGSPELLLAFALRVLTTPLLLLGYVLSGVTGLLWIAVLGRNDLSYAAPMLTGMYFVLLLLTSATLLGESMNMWRWVGTLLIVLGITFISRAD